MGEIVALVLMWILWRVEGKMMEAKIKTEVLLKQDQVL